jgi:hypothetical protein
MNPEDLPDNRAPGAVQPGTAVMAQRMPDRMARYVEHRAKGAAKIEAGLLAGCSPASVRHTVMKWERDARVIEALATVQEEAGMEARTHPADVLRELAILAFSTLDDYEIDAYGNVSPAEDAPPYVMRAVQSIKRRRIVSYDVDGEERIEYKTDLTLWDKVKALRMLGEHMGMWLKRLQIEESGEVKAALASMQGIMQQALKRQQAHQTEEAEIARFQQLADAAATVVSSSQPIEAMKALAEAVHTATPEGR